AGQVSPGVIGKLQVDVDLAQLGEGSNKAALTLQSDSNGGSLTIPVEVQILPSGFPAVTVTPTGLAFVAPDLSSRKVVFAASRSGQVSVGSTQPSWLKGEARPVGNAGGLIQARLFEITVNVVQSGLQPGENRGTITIQDPSGLPVTVSVLVYVPPGNG